MTDGWAGGRERPAGPHGPLPQGRRAPALGAVRSAVRRDLTLLLRSASDPAGPVAAAGPRPSPLVLVACSGGPDSLALAAALAAETTTPARTPVSAAGLRAGAVVVDHGWHPGSADVAARTAAVLVALGLAPVVTARADDHGAGGPEARARRGRHAALAGAAADHGALAVLLGHTRDDQAEQVLLGLARGSGARSLAGMPAVRGVLRRPLLGLARATTVAACAEAGLDPWHDPSNTDPAYARARVRTSALPTLERELGPGVAAALVRTADQLRADADALDALAADLADRAVRSVTEAAGGSGGGCEVVEVVEVDLAALAGRHEALRTRVLRAAALRAGCPATDLARSHVLALADLARGPAAGRGLVRVPGGVAAARCCGTLRLWTQRT